MRQRSQDSPGIISKALVSPKMSWLDNFGVDLGGGDSRRPMKKAGLLEVFARPRAPTEKPDGGTYFRVADGHAWLIAEAGSGFALGSEVALMPEDGVCGTESVHAHGKMPRPPRVRERCR